MPLTLHSIQLESVILIPGRKKETKTGDSPMPCTLDSPSKQGRAKALCPERCADLRTMEGTPIPFEHVVVYDATKPPRPDPIA